jgi:hypothetical protein
VTAGIPTTYRYNAMRSRLEARWAAFFDLIGWSWTYEPLDADGYIPDFLIHGDAPFLVEVGSCVTQSEYIAKGEKARRAFPGHHAVIGEPLDQVKVLLPERWVAVVGVTATYRESRWRRSAFGLLAQETWPGEGFASPLFWEQCEKGHVGVLAPAAGFGTWPCGHPFDQVIVGPGADEIEDLWARAGSSVQWKSRPNAGD